jgi:predicted transcriptional regulator
MTMISITLSNTVEQAQRALTTSRQPAAVVWDHGAPVGVITLADLSRSPHCRAVGALVVDVMSHECVKIHPAADLSETHRSYREAAWESLRRRRPFSQATLDRRAAAACAA